MITLRDDLEHAGTAVLAMFFAASAAEVQGRDCDDILSAGPSQIAEPNKLPRALRIARNRERTHCSNWVCTMREHRPALATRESNSRSRKQKARTVAKRGICKEVRRSEPRGVTKPACLHLLTSRWQREPGPEEFHCRFPQP